MSTIPCLAVGNLSIKRLLSDQTVQSALRIGLVELRLDLLPVLSHSELESLISTLNHSRLVITYRHPSEGGGRAIPETQRIDILSNAIRRNVAYVDLELAFADGLNALVKARTTTGSQTKIILSQHNFNETPTKVADIADAMRSAGADIAKLACRVDNPFDNLRLLDFLRASKIPAIAVGMGDSGLISRILGAKYGMPFTFCSLGGSEPTASGQPTFDECINVYRVQSITSKTPVYGVIGDPISQSKSPQMQNAALRASGIDAVYLPFRVSGDPATFIQTFRDYPGMNLRGLSITIPHKVKSMTVADRLDPLAKRIGAINTLAFLSDGDSLGANTDAYAAANAIEFAAGGPSALAGKRALILGAGGSARAVAFALAEKNVIGCIANRTVERAKSLADEVGFEYCSLDDAPGFRPDIVANMTSVGMAPDNDSTPLTASALPGEGGVVFDAVYHPRETRLLREAKDKGATVVEGLEMLVGQGAEQFKLWHGISAPLSVMKTALGMNA